MAQRSRQRRNIQTAWHWSVRQLIEPADQDDPASELQELKDWQWLAQVMLAALPQRSHIILPQIARVVGVLGQQMRVESGPRETFELKAERLRDFFGEGMDAVVHALANANSNGDWVLEEARRQASSL